MTPTWRLRAILRQTIGDGLLDRRRRLDMTAAQRLGRKPVRHHLDPAAFDHLGHLFELPLVHDEIVAAQDALLER